jgi:acyl transferase domain-containing protein/NAD(P)-dependent dehydrogenase (short-subunit alcohol dehydrogenase family)/acyl carrier protein
MEDRRRLMQRALRRIRELEQELAAARAQRREPIAIVGMACRLPGGVTTPDEYWQLLVDGTDAIRPFPPDRMRSGQDAAALYGGFVDGIDQFDASLFGITPREARCMDPQQRVLLETAWRALEDAGEPPSGLAGSSTGVFVGITTNEYSRVIGEVAPDAADVYVATGNALNAAAGRVSFALGFHGPSMAIDTACSSSLVAIHTACRSLRAGECDLALAGGVNLVLRPDHGQLFSNWGMMARDGRCKTFDAAADGFVRSDGCGVLVLRRWSDARSRGHRVLAAILGSSVNQDGRSSGLTVPNGRAQQALIRQALSDAGVTAEDIDYVEAHGTGTSLGDPIEMEALAHALGTGRSPDRPLLVGSVKTNIGHAESASGVAGLMKVVLALQHGIIPAHLHFKDPSPNIPWDLAPLKVVTSATAWPARADRRRLAGVSSFGFSGTNAHVIVGTMDANADDGRAVPERQPLAPTPFHRERYWVDTSARRQDPDRNPPDAHGHALLGRQLALAAQPAMCVWEAELTLDRVPYVADHRVRHQAVFPATAYAELAFAAAADRFGWHPLALTDLDFQHALVLTAEARIVLQVFLEGSAEEFAFAVHGRRSDRGSGRFVLHAAGRGRRLSEAEIADAARYRFADCRARCTTVVAGETFYRLMCARGNDWGPTFQGTRELYVGVDEACARVEPPASIADDLPRSFFHPAVADACGHVLVAAAEGSALDKRSGALVGRSIEEIRLYRPARGRLFHAWAVQRAGADGPHQIRGDIRVFDAEGELVSEALGATLYFPGGGRGSASSAEHSCYVVGWEEARIAASATTLAAGPVVILDEDAAHGRMLVASLRREGLSAEQIRVAADGSLRLLSRDEADSIVATCDAEQGAGGHIVYVCEPRREDAVDVDAFERVVVTRCGSVLHVAQALSARSPAVPTRLWVVTRQAQSLSGEVPDPSQAPLWGLGRSLAAECGTAWGGLIDIEPSTPAAELAIALRGFLGLPRGEDQWAYRAGWYVPRLTRMPPTSEEAVRIETDGAYLITGGLGGLGLVVAQWLASRGVRQLILVGRRGLPTRDGWSHLEDPELAHAVDVVRRLEDSGISVRIEAADVGVAADVARVLASSREAGTRLLGIVHTAGEMQYEALPAQSVDSFRRVFAGKLRGAWLLDRAREPDIRHFVLFSSASSILSSPFVGAYAAANACLDAMAAGRGPNGRRMLSVNWGAWAEVGMVARFDGPETRRGELSRRLSPAEAIAALERALASGFPQVVVLPTDWEEWRRQYGTTGAAPLLSGLMAPIDQPSPASERSDAMLPPATGHQVTERLREQFARVMGLRADAVDERRSLVAMGLDSMMAVEVRALFETHLGVTIPLMRFLEGATIADIAADVEALVGHATDQGSPPPRQLFAVEEGEI